MSDIYNIIDKKKLDVVNKPISEAHGLPNECYTSKEYTKIERKKLFEDKWVVIGAASSLPNIGDTKPFDLLDLPILIVRDSDNKIKVFHNVCSHRGYKLVHKAGNIKNVIRCPYHSWSYAPNGKLIALSKSAFTSTAKSDPFIIKVPTFKPISKALISSIPSIFSSLPIFAS